MHNKRERLGVPTILALVAVITSAVSAWSGYSSAARVIESARRREFETTVALLQQSMAEQADKASARATLIASLPSIQQAFRAGDREQLVARLGPAFQDQQERFGVREAQFHKSPAIAFLRLSAPAEGHGEDQSSFREMVLTANLKHQPQRGVELGRRGLSIRGNTPVDDKDGPIGSFEIEMDFGSVLETVKNTSGYEAGVFVNHAKLTEVSTLLPKADPERIVGGFQNTDATNWSIIREVVTPDLLARSRDVSTATRTINGTQWGVVCVPLLDFKGARFGAVVAARSFEAFGQQLRHALVSALAAAAVQLFLLLGTIRALTGAGLFARRQKEPSP